MLVAAAFISTGLGVLNAVIRYLIPPRQSIGGTSEKIEVATVAELPEGAAKYFAYDNQPCAVINVGGEIRGFTRVCTHLQCAIDWDQGSKTFLCPCHAAVFDSNGKVVSGPAPSPLPRLKVVVQNDKIYAGGWA
jgi:Rieske Fe-S protein